MMSFFKTIMCISVAMVSNNLCAAVYKHIDDSGRVLYSDHPFRYKQETMEKEKSAERLIPGWKRDKRKFVYGVWELRGSSRHHGGLLDSKKDIWTFGKDGILSKKYGDSGGVTGLYEYLDNYLEISGKGSRLTYKVMELTSNKMVLKLLNDSKYLYFSRFININKGETATYYQRDQVAKIVAMLACGEITQDKLKIDEAREQNKNIFIKTGIENFDDKKFVNSVKFYRNDDTFRQVYEPKITKVVEKCSKQVATN